MKELVQLPFKHSKGLEVGLDILTFEALYQREESLNHRISDPHRTEFYILIYVTSGTGSHTVDFHTFDISPHTLALISKQQINQFDPIFSLHGYIILITEEFLQRALFDLDRITSSLLFEPITTQAYFLRKASSVLPHIERLAEEYHHGQFDSQHVPILTRELGILLLKAERLRHSQLQESVNSAETSPRLIAYRDLLELHFKKHWTAQMYADALGFSTKTLNELSRTHLNRSPKEVIDQRLLLELKRLLAHTDLSIKEIAYDLGFADPSNVNKFFRRMHGSTPSVFRQKVRNQE